MPSLIPRGRIAAASWKHLGVVLGSLKKYEWFVCSPQPLGGVVNFKFLGIVYRT